MVDSPVEVVDDLMVFRQVRIADERLTSNIYIPVGEIVEFRSKISRNGTVGVRVAIRSDENKTSKTIWSPISEEDFIELRRRALRNKYRLTNQQFNEA